MDCNYKNHFSYQGKWDCTLFSYLPNGNNLITCNFYKPKCEQCETCEWGNAHTWITCCKNQLHHSYLIDVIDQWWQRHWRRKRVVVRGFDNALEKRKSCERIWQWVRACKETMDTLEVLCKTDHKKHAKTTKGGWCPKAKRFVVVTVDGYGNMEEEEEEGPGNIWTFPGPKKLQKGFQRGILLLLLMGIVLHWKIWLKSRIRLPVALV